jgi:hypothetical protein
MIHMDPTTHETIKVAAPSSSPTARLPEPARIAEKVENRSGDPLPKARNVTPATFSSRPSICAIDARFGEKKSDALMPRNEKRNISHVVRPMKTSGRNFGSVQK